MSAFKQMPHRKRTEFVRLIISLARRTALLAPTNTATRTKAGFTQAGVYTLRLTAGDGVFTRTADVLVTVTNGIATWKAQYFTAAELANPAISGDAADPDGDGHTNLQEYVAGTKPRDPASRLELKAEFSVSGAPLKLRFDAMAGKTYSLQFNNGFGISQWTKLADVAPASTNRVVETFDFSPVIDPGLRFYRVVTPGD